MIKENSLPRVLLLHNVVAPYRLPLFEAISEECNFTVVFCSESNKDRKWNSGLGQSKVGYKYVFMKKITASFYILNPGLLSIIFKQKPDVFILIDEEKNFWSNFTVYLYSRLAQKPYVIWSGQIPVTGTTIHPIEFHKSLMHSLPIKFIIKLFIKKCNHILYGHAKSFLAYSKLSEAYLRLEGVKQNIIVGTQAMSTSLMPKPTKKYQNTPKIKLLYLGYLRPEKGVSVLLDAFMNAKNPDLELNIIGDGPEKKSLEAMAIGRDDIHFHPNVGNLDRANWYTLSDLMILPTYFDPWAHTVTESLYYGTPVLVTTSAGSSSIITPHNNGLLFNAGDVSSLKKILKGLTKEKIRSMKKFVEHDENHRIYDIYADRDNFTKAIKMAVEE
jgi:glycosyltransferase involved in cell wall biosynthesis